MSVSSSYLNDGRARAKINLTLHVGRVLADGHYKGYHPVDSLVVFSGVADRIKYCAEQKYYKLDIQGPFGKALEDDEHNLITRTAQAFFKQIDMAPFGHFILEKNLPIASGIGGGSADAAAAMRLLLRENSSLVKDKITKNDIHKLIESLGADVSVCYHSKTSYMRGIGEELESIPDLGRIPALLVNPGFPVSTAEIFKAFDAAQRPIKPKPQLKRGDLLSRAIAGQNDLQDIAISLHPKIGEIIRRLADIDGCSLSRMSGSGATCFGLFDTFDQAVKARDIILQGSPDYWCSPTLLGDAAWSS